MERSYADDDFSVKRAIEEYLFSEVELEHGEVTPRIVTGSIGERIERM
jgi:hypothetical protein